MFWHLLICLFLSSCSSTQLGEYKLIKVIDGDSLVIQEYNCNTCEDLEVRLIGIDTPEYNQDPWGKRARDFVLSQIKPGDKVFLETGIELNDKYGRTLGYIFYEDKSADKQLRLLNNQILKNGFAEIFLWARNKEYKSLLKESEHYARTHHLNIWKDSGGIKMSPSEYRKRYMK